MVPFFPEKDIVSVDGGTISGVGGLREDFIGIQKSISLRPNEMIHSWGPEGSVFDLSSLCSYPSHLPPQLTVNVGPLMDIISSDLELIRWT